MDQEFERIVQQVCEKDLRYKEDAYSFVMEALNFTQKKNQKSHHVNSEELLVGMKELVLQKFGPMAKTVLSYWGIKSTVDFGNIVFNLVENRILSKTEDDNIDSFRDGYDFDEVFIEGYRKNLAKKISRMR